jgi:FSR family fosmidomycin resistance protein-like MFS transporter
MDGNDRSIVGFTMLAHAMFHTYELSIPIFVAVWLDVYPVSAALLGTIVSVGYALIGIGALPSGILADSYGSKTLVIGSILGMGGGFLALSLAPNVAFIGLALVFWGAGASLYHPAGLSLLSRGADERGNAFAYHGAAGNVGTVVGPLAAVVLLIFLNWRVVAVLFVLPALVAVVIALRIDFDETAASETATDGGITTLSGLFSQSRVLFTGGFVVVFAIILSFGLYYRGILTFLPEVLGTLSVLEPVTVFGRSFAPSRYVYSGLLLVGVFGQYAGGKLSDRVSPERALVATFLALVVASLLFVPAIDMGVGALLLVCGLLGFFLYVAVPIYQAAVAEYASDDAHGLSYGYTYLAMFGIGALGASVAGLVLTYLSTGLLFVVLAVFAGVCALLSARLVIGSRVLPKRQPQND